MLKNILKLEGTQKLTEIEQKLIKAGTEMPKKECLVGFCMDFFLNCIRCER